jgi:hypothetical protein
MVVGPAMSSMAVNFEIFAVEVRSGQNGTCELASESTLGVSYIWLQVGRRKHVRVCTSRRQGEERPGTRDLGHRQDFFRLVERRAEDSN